MCPAHHPAAPRKDSAGLRVLLRSKTVRSIKSITFLERYYGKRKREEAA